VGKNVRTEKKFTYCTFIVNIIFIILCEIVFLYFFFNYIVVKKKLFVCKMIQMKEQGIRLLFLNI